MPRLAAGVGLAIAVSLGAPSELSAHDAVKAVIIVIPGQPRVGQPCAVSVSVLAPPGLPLLDQIEGVRVTGEMTGHAMTPVEAPLAPANGRGGYAGTFALTMGGPWRMTLRVKVLNEEMWAVFPVDAAGPDQSADPAGMRYVVEMRDPVRANVLSPWWVLGLTLGLTAIAEGTAVAATIRRRRLTREPPRSLTPTAKVPSPVRPGTSA